MLDVMCVVLIGADVGMFAWVEGFVDTVVTRLSCLKGTGSLRGCDSNFMPHIHTRRALKEFLGNVH